MELVDAINKGLETNIIPIFGKKRAGDIPHSNASVEKAKEMLDYNPNISFEEGIKKLLNR